MVCGQKRRDRRVGSTDEIFVQNLEGHGQAKSVVSRRAAAEEAAQL